MSVCSILLDATTRLLQGCIFRLTCPYFELTEDHVLTSAYVRIFRTVTRNAVNKSVWRKKDYSWIILDFPLQTCNEYLFKFSENQSAPKLEIRKTSPFSPCALNLLHVLISRIPGYHNLCSPDLFLIRTKMCLIIPASWNRWQKAVFPMTLKCSLESFLMNSEWKFKYSL